MLRIAKKEFNQRNGKPSSETFKNIIIPALNQLQEPDLISNEATSIAPEEAILCLQQEIAYVDLLNPVNNIKHIKYIGSKNVLDCILVYIHTETDHLVVHVDSSYKLLNLYPSIAAFTYKDYIQVYLVGGKENCETSFKNIEKIIKELYDVAIQLNSTIEITKQKVLDRNNYKKDKIYQTIFDYLLGQIDLVCRQFFKDPLNENDLKNFSISDFKTRIIDFDDKTDETFGFVTAAKELYDKNDESDNERINYLSKINTKYDNKFKFLEAVKKLFCINVFNQLRVIENELLRGEGRQLVNFVFDLNTKKIHVINGNLKTINTELRAIRFLHNNNDIDYFVCYDGKLNLWNKIHIDDAIKEAYKNVFNYVNNNVVSRSEVENKIALKLGYNAVNIDNIVGCSKHFNENPIKDTASNIRFFSSSKLAWKKLYQDNITNEQLRIIYDLTKLPFEAKIRKHPAYTVDALYEFNSYLEAEKIQNLLIEKNILCHIIKTNDDDNHQKFQLCIPAINAGQYATNIYQNKI